MKEKVKREGRKTKAAQNRAEKNGSKFADVAHTQGSVMGHDDGGCLRKRQGQRLHTHQRNPRKTKPKTRKAKRKARTEVTGEENVES